MSSYSRSIFSNYHQKSISSTSYNRSQSFSAFAVPVLQSVSSLFTLPQSLSATGAEEEGAMKVVWAYALIVFLETQLSSSTATSEREPEEEGSSCQKTQRTSSKTWISERLLKPRVSNQALRIGEEAQQILDVPQSTPCGFRLVNQTITMFRYWW